MPHNSSAEMPVITAYTMTVGVSPELSSAGAFFDEPLEQPTFYLGNQTQIQQWSDKDHENKEKFQQDYDKHLALAAEDLKKEVFGGHEATILAVDELNEEEEGMKKRALRVVQVFVADRHPDVPLEYAIVYQSPKPFATDMTNQELYFTINLMDLLEAHNAKRVMWHDKQATKQAGKTVVLEEIRISDLDMQVTAFTEFA